MSPISAMTPTFGGQVVINKVTPRVSPSFDENFDVQPYPVDPIENLPTFDHGAAVTVTSVVPSEPTIDSEAKVSISKVEIS